MRAFLNSDFKSAMPSTLLPAFKPMKVVAANGNGETTVESVDTFALPAEKEILGRTVWGNSVAESELFQFKWYENASKLIKNVNGSAYSYWDRTVYSYSSSSVNFCCINRTGQGGFSTATNTFGVSPFGCI